MEEYENVEDLLSLDEATQIQVHEFELIDSVVHLPTVVLKLRLN